MEKTIEERAIEFASNDNKKVKLPDGELKLLEFGYKCGADEQKKIDIEKACEWIIDTYLGDYVVDGFGDNVKLAEELRKAMEK